MGSAWWLASVLAVNVTGAHISPIAAIAGAGIAPLFAAGDWSPDSDLTWLSRLGHRQATHRPDTTAVSLTALTALVWIPLALTLPLGIHWLAWAPVTGWWSHLIGDAIFGRIPCGRALGRALRPILGQHIVRQDPTGRQAYWVGLGWDTDGILERGKRKDGTRALPFAPTTGALRGATGLLAIAVAAQWWMATP
jgi:hypothetical protein